MLMRRVISPAIVCLAVISSLSLAGCGIGGSTATQPTRTVTVPVIPTAAPGHITGMAHGGRQPISGGAVTLWAAGTTGTYGTGATSIATTTTATDGSGSFDLDVSSTTTSPCTAGQLNYITITGGDPGGGDNSSSALMLALPQPCSAITGSLSAVVNEVTTVASVWSLQQFMSITPGGSPAWQIGAPSTNVTGLTNAFAQVSQLINNLSQGTTGTSIVASTVTVGSTPTSYYTVITPDAARISMVADILAACVNTTDNAGDVASAVCSNLFTDVSPAGAVLPTDTIQAAYDIATAPGGITEYARAGTSTTIPAGTTLSSPAGSCTSVGCTWALAMCNDFVVANTPFITTACSTGSATVQSYPSDFAIGVRWSAYDSGTLAYGVKQGNVAVDAKGDIWSASTAATAATGNPLLEWDAQGHVLQTVGGTFTMPSGVVTVATVSTGGVAGSTLPFSYSAPPNVTLSPATSTIPFIVFGLAVDTNNNAWVTDHLAAQVTPTLTNGATNFFAGLLLEIPTATVTTAITPTVSQASTVTADSATGGVVTFTCKNAFTAGESVALAGFATNTFLDGQVVTVASASSTQFTATIAGTITTPDAGFAAPVPTAATSTAATAVPYITGSTPGALAIDSANNIWVNAEGNAASGFFNQLMLMTSASGYQNIFENLSESTNSSEEILIDGLNNYAWSLSNASTATGKAIYRSSVTTAATSLGTLNISGGYNATSPGTPPSAYGINPKWGAIDGSNGLWVSEGTTLAGQIAYFAIPATNFSPVPNADISNDHTSAVSTSYVANTSIGGLQGVDAVAVDGVGNVFFGNGVAQTASGISEFTGAGNTNPGVAVSPTNASTGMPAFGFNTFATETPKAMAIDASGNIWAGSGSNVYALHMVGQGAPVITPMASAVAPATAAITAWSIGSTATVATFTVPNSYTVGEKVLLSGFGTSTFLNGQTVTTTAVSGTSFTATVTGGTVNTGATESGIASTSRLGTRP